MEMENVLQALIILLSSVLIVFLLICITLFLYILKLVKSVRRISLKAETLTDKAEAVSEFVQHAAVPMLVGKIVASFADAFSSRKSKR
jgi:ABC-type phosphate transport system permease subunit